jgi:hypothetical protein
MTNPPAASRAVILSERKNQAKITAKTGLRLL